METSSSAELIGDFGQAVRAIDELASLKRKVLAARRERNDAVRALCSHHGPAATARMLNMKLPTVKAINRK